MTPTRIILRTLQVALLATALAPASSFAGTAPTTHQILAQASTLGPTVEGEAKKVTTRGLIVSDAQASEPTNSDAQHSVVIPAIAPVVVPPLPATAAAPTRDTIASITTLPPPPVATYSTSTTATDTSAATVVPSTPVAPATVVATQSKTTTATPAVVAKGERKSDSDAHLITPSTSRAVSGAKIASMQSTLPHVRRRANDELKINIGNLRRQFTRFINRRELKSLIAAYLN